MLVSASCANAKAVGRSFGHAEKTVCLMDFFRPSMKDYSYVVHYGSLLLPPRVTLLSCWLEVLPSFLSRHNTLAWAYRPASVLRVPVV